MRRFRSLVLPAAITCAAASACLAASQLPIAELKPIATFKLGKTADWVAITPEAVWVASTGPFAVNRIDPKSNAQVASVKIPGAPCAGLAVGGGSLWVPMCGKKPSLAKIDLGTNQVTSIFPVGPPRRVESHMARIAFGLP